MKRCLTRRPGSPIIGAGLSERRVSEANHGDSRSSSSDEEEANPLQGQAQGTTGHGGLPVREAGPGGGPSPSVAIKPAGFCPAPSGLRSLFGDLGKWLSANGSGCPPLGRTAAIDGCVVGSHQEGITWKMATDAQRGV